MAPRNSVVLVFASYAKGVPFFGGNIWVSSRAPTTPPTMVGTPAMSSNSMRLLYASCKVLVIIGFISSGQSLGGIKAEILLKVNQASENRGCEQACRGLHRPNRWGPGLLLRGGILNRTHGMHKTLCICLFLLTIFGPVNYGPPGIVAIKLNKT